MKVKQVQYSGWLVALSLFAVAAGLAAWFYWPAPLRQESIELTAQDLRPGPFGLEGTGSQGNAQPVAALRLEWPAWSHTGERQVIRLHLEPLTSPAGQSQTGGADHRVAETRLDIGLLTPQPDGTAQQPWLPGQSILFTWTVQPLQAGIYEGDVWFTLIFFRHNGSMISRKDISAQNVRLNVVDFMGIPPGLVWWASLGCGIAGIGILFWRPVNCLISHLDGIIKFILCPSESHRVG